MRKGNAIVLADTRPALVGTVLIQLKKTNPDLFCEAIIYYDTPISETDRKLMLEILPCRFVQYNPPIPKAILEKEDFKRFSVLMFCRYEMFLLLDEFETVTWLDTDVLIQGDLSPLIASAKKTGAAFIREDPTHKTSENTDHMDTCFLKDVPGFNMKEYLYCSGTIILSQKVKNIAGCTDWCYRKTIEWADILLLPDQGVLNAAIQKFEIKVTPVPGKVYCCYPYLGRDCSRAKIIHSWGKNKFWNDWYTYLHFPDWNMYYKTWCDKGGTKLPFEIQPKISVLIPSYRPNLKWMKECIGSLQNQTRSNWERFSDFEIIIIAEPFKIDKLKKFVDSFCDLRIRLEINETRLGIAASLNKGICLARGKYIARLDDDDLCAPMRLFTQMEYLEQHPEISLCTSDFEYFGDMNEQRISFEGDMSFAWSIFTCPFDHPSVMMRKDFFLDNQLFYDESRGYVEDWELWRRAFKRGMKVGCIHKVLFFHRWINGASAGQTNKTAEMMQELIHTNFLELGIDIPDSDLSLIGPWNGRLDSAQEFQKLKRYFSLALKANMEKQIYKQDCLKTVFSLRLEEADTGCLSRLVRPAQEINTLVIRYQHGKGITMLKKFIKKMLKPFYQPFRHRYEEPLNKVYYSIDPILELLKSLQALSQTNAQKLLQIEDELSNIKSEMHRHIDFIYRDIMIAMEIQKPFLSICDVVLVTSYPIAYKSLDHLYSQGAVRDNTRYPRFIEKCEEIFERKTNLSFLDLGCSGGGLVLDAALKGHLSVGLEGSNCFQEEQRAEWRLLGGRLKTCDISKPFSLYKADGTVQSFDIISAWEVLEHIEERDLLGLFDNINRHLSDDGIFVASIANYNDFDRNTGINRHVTVHPYVWWETKFREAGYFVCTDLFDVIDLPRGGYNPPHCYENPYSEIDRSKTFHIAVKRIKQKENE